MISLEQIHQLDKKVASAVQLIDELRRENNSLKEKLGTYQKRIDELEILISEFKEDQGEIEEGIVHALKQLEELGVQPGEQDLEKEASSGLKPASSYTPSGPTPTDEGPNKTTGEAPQPDVVTTEEEELKPNELGDSKEHNGPTESEDKEEEGEPEEEKEEDSGPSTELDIF